MFKSFYLQNNGKADVLVLQDTVDEFVSKLSRTLRQKQVVQDEVIQKQAEQLNPIAGTANSESNNNSTVGI